MRAALAVLLLSGPAFGQAVMRARAVPALPPLAFPVAPRLSAPALAPSPLSPALSLSAPSEAPKPAPAAVPAPAPEAPPAPAERSVAARVAAAAEQVAAEAAASAAAAEMERARAAVRFDGSILGPLSPTPVLAVPEGAHPGWSVRAAKDEDAEWLAGVVAALRESRTGRRLLKDVDAMSAARGRAVLVHVARLSNNAEVRYDSGLLVMDKNHRRKPVRLAAPIMAHELQHVLQKASEFIPVDSLEMEIESYTVEARVWNELGLKPPPNSFARNAKARLEKDPDAFFAWLAGEYDKNVLLHGTSDDAYALYLEGEKTKVLKKIANVEKRIRSIERVLERMRVAGVPSSQVDAHHHDELLPALATLREHRLAAAWVERDIALLSTAEGRKRFRDYSRGVIRRARAMRLPEA